MTCYTIADQTTQTQRKKNNKRKLLNMAAEMKNGDLHNRSLQIRFRMLNIQNVDIPHET